MTNELDVVRRLRPEGAADPAVRAAARARMLQRPPGPRPARTAWRRRGRRVPNRALVPALALVLAAAVLVGVRPGDGGSGPTTSGNAVRHAPGASVDVPTGGLAPGTAWYVRRLEPEPLSGRSPAAGRDWNAVLPLRTESWAAPDGAVTAHVVVAGRARFASEADRLAYLASGSKDADLAVGTVLVDGRAAADGALAFLGPKADVGRLPARVDARTVDRLVRGAMSGPPPSGSGPMPFAYDAAADRLGAIVDLLAIAPLPRAYRLALVDDARHVPGVREQRSGEELRLALGATSATATLDAVTGQLRGADDLGLADGRIEAQSVVGRVGERP